MWSFIYLVPLAQSPWTTFRSDSISQSCNIRRKMRKDEYIKECMVWKSGKKVFFFLNSVYSFFNFQFLRKKYETRVAGNGSNYCPIFYLFLWNPKIEGIRAFLHAFFYKRILYNIPLKNACKKAHRSLHKS